MTELDDDKRNALLHAARELFLKNTYDHISIRRIAEKAEVNSALIAYYFGSKSGLFQEMFRSYIQENIERASQAVDGLDRMSLRDFLTRFYTTMPPEFTQLVIRTLLFERGEIREWLLEHLLKPAFATGTALAESAIKKKGSSHDPMVVRTSLQSMMLMPKLLQPLLKELYPEQVDAEFFDKLASFQADMVSQYFSLEEN